MAQRATKRQRTHANGNGRDTAAGGGAGGGAGAGVTGVAASAATLTNWKRDTARAEAMIPLIGELYRTRNVVVTLYGRSLVNKSVIDIIKTHKWASETYHASLSVGRTAAVLEAISRMAVAPMRLDIGKAAQLFQHVFDDEPTAWVSQLVTEIASTLAKHTAAPVAQTASGAKPKDIVLYGFGRIGRLVARLLIEKTGAGSKMLLRAIVVRKKAGADLKKRASLLAMDSVHGMFDGTVDVDEKANTITANGNTIQLIYASNPGEVDYTAYGINNAIVIDNTGIWRDRKGLSQHLNSKGVAKVVLTAPSKSTDIPSVVAGVNYDRISDSDTIIAAASCTTNAIVPTLKLMNDKFGITSAHLETVHSYTNDQNLIDNYHAKARRGRAAALNMVVTETGAAKAVARSLPELAGKLTGSAVRVPTPDVSLAMLFLDLETEVTTQEVNDMLTNEATYGDLHLQIGVSTSEDAVSSDFVGDRRTGIVDLPQTIVSGKRCNLYVWYDNEFGYACQVVRVLQRMAGILFTTFPSDATMRSRARTASWGRLPSPRRSTKRAQPSSTTAAAATATAATS